MTSTETLQRGAYIVIIVVGAFMITAIVLGILIGLAYGE